jgi:type I restriction enzyme S subunit
MNAERLLAHYEKIAGAPDATARLRRFVLDLAVRGKLVPQNPNDEPASELLKRIAAEKARLVKAGEIRKPRPLPEPDESEHLSIPSTWAQSRLGALSTVVTKGSTPTSYGHQFTSAGVNFVKVESIVNGRLSPETISSFISPATHAFLGRSQLTAGDILFSIAGSIGTCAVVTEELLPANTNQALAIVRGTATCFDPAFLIAVLRSRVADVIRAKARGGAMNNVSLEDVQRMLLPLPPFAEQRRIVAKVDELMALCDRLEAARQTREATRDKLTAASLARLNAPDPETFRDDARFALDALPALTARPDQIKQLRQTILNLAVRGKLVPQYANDEPATVRRAHDVPEMEGRLDAEIPPNWRWVRVEDVADARLGKMLDKAKNKGRLYPYLRNTNVHWFEIRLDDLKTIPLGDAEFEEYRLKDGDVLICEGGHGIGRTAVWRGVSDNLVFQKALHRVRPGKHLDPSFFARCCFVYFDAGIMQTYFTGVGILHFTGRALAKLVFPLPPLAEQHRIVAKVDELMRLCDRLEASLATADDTRRRLLDALLAEVLVPTNDRELEAAE